MRAFRLLILMISAGLACFGSIGCANMPTMQDWTAGFRMKGDDFVHPADEPQEKWIESAGNEARGDRPMTKDGDPLNKWLMSPKARDITMNMGVDPGF